MALVVWAAVLEAARPRARRAGASCCSALAGLLRPEAWILAGAVLPVDGVAARPGASASRYAALAAVGAADLGRGRLRRHRRPAVLAALHELARPRTSAASARWRSCPSAMPDVLRRTSSSCRCCSAARARASCSRLSAGAAADGDAARAAARGHRHVRADRRRRRVGDRALPGRRRARAAGVRRGRASAAARCCGPGRRADRAGWSASAVLVLARRRLHRHAPRTSRASTTSCASAATRTPTLDERAARARRCRRGLRCGPLTRPNHKLVPDSRWIARPAATTRVLARADPDAPRAPPRRGVAIVVTSRFAIFRHACTNPADPTLDPGPARRLAARSRRRDFVRRVCPLLSGAGCVAGRASPRSCVGALGAAAVGHPATACRTSTTPTRTRTSCRARSGCSGTPQPGLLHQPAGVHVPAARGVRARLRRRATARRRRLRGRPERRRSRSRAALSARARRARRRAAARGRARGCSTAASGFVAARAAGGRLPARPLRATSRSTTCRRWRRCASRWSASPAIYARGRPRDYVLAGVGARARAARPSTRPGSCCCRCSPRRSSASTSRARRGVARARARGRAGAARRSSSPTRTRCSTSTRSATGLQQAVRGRERRRRQARADRRAAGSLYYLGTLDLGARLAAGAGRARRRGRCCACATGGARSCSCRALVAVPALHGHAGPLLRALAAAGLPARCACSPRTARSRALARRACGGPRAGRPRVGGACCCARRGSCSRSTTTVVLARDDTRQLARDWMVDERPGGHEGRDRADRARPVGERRRARAARHDRQRRALDQVADVALARQHRRHAAQGRPRADRQARGLRAHAAPAARRASTPTRGYCWVRHRLDPVRPRARRARGGPAGDPLLRRAAAQRPTSSSASARYAAERAGRSRSTSRSTPTRSPTSARGRRS